MIFLFLRYVLGCTCVTLDSALPMDAALLVLKQWLWVNAFLLPVYGLILWIFSIVLSQCSVMQWTRPKEIGSHPLLEARTFVRYLGGVKYPLPHRFGVFHAWPLVIIYPAFSVYSSLERLGFSWLERTSVMLGVLVVYLIPLLLLSRWLQPRWLKQHLASLPPDAQPPEPSAAKHAAA